LVATNLSLSTVGAYLEAVGWFAGFLSQQRMPRPVGAIRRKHVEGYIRTLVEMGRASATAATRYRALTVLQMARGRRRDLGLADCGACAPKVDDVDVPVTPVAQLHKLLAACMGPSFEDRRAAALILMMLDTRPPRVGDPSRHLQRDGDTGLGGREGAAHCV
jgi:hypothetical protein